MKHNKHAELEAALGFDPDDPEYAGMMLILNTVAALSDHGGSEQEAAPNPLLNARAPASEGF